VNRRSGRLPELIRILDPDPGQIPMVRILIKSTGTVCGIAIGIPPGWPTPCAMRSTMVVRGWGVSKVTRRPIPADSIPSGTGDGDGWIVLRTWGAAEEGEMDAGRGWGYVGWE
jgi:hypothetical protein